VILGHFVIFIALFEFSRSYWKACMKDNIIELYINSILSSKKLKNDIYVCGVKLGSTQR